MTHAAAFELRGAGVRYGDFQALDGVDLTLRSGEAVAFVGPSGAGKSTLLGLLNGTRRPTAGSVLVDGTDLAELSGSELRRVRSSIGFVHQDLALVPNLRVIQNVIAGRLGHMGTLGAVRAMLLPKSDEAERVHELLERVGIGDKLYQRTDRLSGGQRQRVAIARALYQDPVALLADEPVSSVDPARARDTVELLTGISEERGLTLGMSLHDLELARGHFPRLVALRAGRVVLDDSPDAIPPEDYARLYELSDDEMFADGA